MGTIAFEVDDSFISEMTNIIQKYKDWNKKASTKGIKLDKEIARLKTKKAFWKWGDDWHSSRPIYVTFQFFSQSTQKHQLVLLFSKMQSPYNQYSDHQAETLYFDYSEALKLIRVFSKQRFEKFKKELERKKNIEDEFK